MYVYGGFVLCWFVKILRLSQGRGFSVSFLGRYVSKKDTGQKT